MGQAIPTRCPNGLPELSPFQVYDTEEAERAIASAEANVNAVKRCLLAFQIALLG